MTLKVFHGPFQMQSVKHLCSILQDFNCQRARTVPLHYQSFLYLMLLHFGKRLVPKRPQIVELRQCIIFRHVASSRWHGIGRYTYSVSSKRQLRNLKFSVCNCQMLTHFKNIYTAAKHIKFAPKRMRHYATHLTHVNMLLGRITNLKFLQTFGISDRKYTKISLLISSNFASLCP